ncbi:MAG TPA: nickel pincer cofactor biosynthesis protein LarC [Acidimicrobiales bacterium]
MTDPAPRPTTIAWFHCFAGIAGDMALGSLIDAGADVDELRALLGRIALDGWELVTEPVLRGGIAATAAIVRTRDPAGRRTHADIVELVGAAGLPDRVTERALGTFGALAEVEGALHGRPAAEVHFHEVGGHDAIIDVVGTAAALELLGVDVVTASSVATGTGTVRTAHGVLPNPPPAVTRLLRGIPAYGRETPVELTTPTGAALLATLASGFGPMPAMRVTSTGFGAGGAELPELPNCTQVVIGTTPVDPEAVGPGQPVLTLEANLDDATGEQLGHALEVLLAAGAHDAWITPVLMKKGRPGHVLSVLADPGAAGRLRRLVTDLTGSFGVRATAGERWPAARSMHEVDVEGLRIAIKAAGHRAKAEFADVVAAAEALGRPTHEVASLAEEAWRRARAGEPGPGADAPGGQGTPTSS